MRKITSILFAFFLFSNTNAQYFWGATSIPTYPAENDSIIISDTVSYNNQDYRVTSSIITSSDSIFLSHCYRRGAGQGGRTDEEKTNIGKLTKGTYTIIIQGFFQAASNPTCFVKDSFFNTISFPLEVLAYPNAISAIALSSVSISPTVVKEKIEISGLLNERSVIEVYDLQGKMLHNITTKNSTTSLQMGNLASGVYIVIVRVGSEQKRWKILKE